MDNVLKPVTEPISNEEWLKRLGYGWRESLTGGEAKAVLANCKHSIEGKRIIIELEDLDENARNHSAWS